MTRDQISVQIRATACCLRERGLSRQVAHRIATKAVLRAAGTASAGLGATEAPAILANISAAGDDPAVAAARGAVSKWSWLIPVGGLLMSAKNKISEWRSPVAAAMVGAGRRR